MGQREVLTVQAFSVLSCFIVKKGENSNHRKVERVAIRWQVKCIRVQSKEE